VSAGVVPRARLWQLTDALAGFRAPFRSKRQGEQSEWKEGEEKSEGKGAMCLGCNLVYGSTVHDRYFGDRRPRKPAHMTLQQSKANSKAESTDQFPFMQWNESW